MMMMMIIIIISLKEVYVPSLWWLTVFKDDFFGFRVWLNLKLIETRRKAHNKRINTLSRLIHAGERLEIYELSISWPPTEQYDRTILSLLVRCLFIGRENINTTLFIIISIFLG